MERLGRLRKSGAGRGDRRPRNAIAVVVIVAAVVLTALVVMRVL